MYRLNILCNSPTEHGKPTKASTLLAWWMSYAIPTANFPLQLPLPTTILLIACITYTNVGYLPTTIVRLLSIIITPYCKEQRVYLIESVII